MSESLLEELLAICGPGFARQARSVDRVAGRRAGYVAVPSTSRSVAATLRLARERGLTVRARGAGSKIDWGRPPAGLDLIVDTGRLNGMWDHHGATAVVAAGTSVTAVQAALALRGKRLAVDPPSPGATIGGMLAVNESGPLSHRFHSPAEQTLSVGYVDVDGIEADSDGEGDRPPIADIEGVITSAVLTVEPLPATRLWVGRVVTTPAEVADLVNQALLRDSELSAVEVNLAGNGAGTVALLIEGDDGEAIGRAGKITQSWGEQAVITDKVPPWWGRYPFTAGDVAIRISVEPTGLQAVSYALRDLCGKPVPIRGSAGTGTIHAVLPAGLTPARITSIVEGLDYVLVARGGKIVVVSAPPDVAEEVTMARPHDLF
ncbi:FAD-binding oxidoreductase [Actinoplanes sp. NPDC051851]|uniref:FAD-binding oxidoreductase n=1 Tax=Actinoplanes sp. NPDC051851 TaxID=3154753 RepID=UPI00343D7656